MRYLFFIVSLVTIFTAPASALTTARIFGSKMVLQRDMKVPVWGTAAPNADVSLSFAGQNISGKADSEGKWRLELAPLKTSAENQSLTIKSGDKELVLENILVGDVWFGSGQSNMAGRVASYAKNDPTLAEIAGTLTLRQDEPPCQHVAELLSQRRDEVAERIANLRQLQDELDMLIRRAGTLDPAECGDNEICHILPAALLH